MIHFIKIKETFAYAVDAGEKNFEVRYNDRGYQKGDLVSFTVVKDTDPTDVIATHPLNQDLYRITYVLCSNGIEPGYVVFGIKKEAD